ATVALPAPASNGSACVEGCLDPDEIRLPALDVLHGDDVEADWSCPPCGMAHQQVVRRAQDAAALPAVDARERRHQPVAAPRPDLDDDERLALRADEIELAEPASIALQQRLDAVPLEVRAGRLLPVEPGGGAIARHRKPTNSRSLVSSSGAMRSSGSG